MIDTGSTHEGKLHKMSLTDFSARAKPKVLTQISFILGLLGLGFGASGCSTPGPSHAYLFFSSHRPVVLDINLVKSEPNAEVPTFVKRGENVNALAYEPYTDHLYLRISPGNRVRVIDRPARKVKSEVNVPRLPPGGHDFAIRSRDRHFFFSCPDSPALLETTLEGNFKCYIPIEGLDQPVWGVALDKTSDELLLLTTEKTDLVARFGMDGRWHSQLKLERVVRGLSLDYDPVARLYYACLADGSAIGVFDDKGHLTHTVPCNAKERETLIAVGPRSLLRLF